MFTVVCATTNPGKVEEIADVLAGLDPPVELLPRPRGLSDVVEDADTLVGNARRKARRVCLAIGQPSLADDTGLEVDALDGRPGVRTARFAGEGCSDADNRARLLAELEGVADRRARFRTVVVLAWPTFDEELVAEGVCEGRIAEDERGDRGFGYDAVFIPDDGDGRTFAEMTLAEKQEVSHRARALRSLAAALAERPG